MHHVDLKTQSQISQIVTSASALLALQPEANAEVQARFLSRYQMAIYRYLRAFVRDEDVALELFQEFCLKYLRGDLAKRDRGGGFDSEVGRFSRYLKRILHNLAHDHFAKAKRERVTAENHRAAIEYDEPAPDHFGNIFRQAILDRAWEVVKLAEEESPAIPCYSVLMTIAQRANVSSRELAEQLGTTEANARKVKQRSRQAFADALIESAKEFAGTGRLSEVEQELAELDLLQYCKKAIARRMTIGEKGCSKE